MKIEVKNIKIRSGHGDSQAYEALVMVDGERAFHASNDGWGGPDLFTPVAGYHGAREIEINDWLKANTPKYKVFSLELDNTLERVVGDQVDAVLRDKEIKRIRGAFLRMQDKKIVGLETRGDEVVLVTWMLEPTPTNIQRIKAITNARIVNKDESLQDEALRAYCPDIATA